MTGPGTGAPGNRWWGSAKRLSLRRGLVVLLITALLPITILSILQGLVRLESRRATAIRQLSENARALADSNELILTSTRSMLQVAAMNPALQTRSPACGAALRAVQALSAGYANLSRYDADGELMCAAVPPAGRYRVPDRAAWEVTRRSETMLVSEAVIGPFTGKRIMTVVLPLRDTNGEFKGSIGAGIDLAWLERRLRAATPDTETGVAIVSDTGQRLIASRRLPAFDLGLTIGTVGRTRDGSGGLWSYTLVPLVRAGPGQHGLFVAYAAPDPPRFGIAWWQTIIDFALPVLAILLASLAIWFGAQQLVIRWLVELQRLALHFAGGDYRRRPVTFSEAPREIRSVAAALYRMSSAVGERDRRLRDSLERQRLLARELHHRVKNNFQMVMSLLSLQSSRLEDAGARQAIDQARRRIGALALVHRQLYDTGELASISSRELLDALCQQLQPGADSGIRLVCDFDDIPVDIDTAVPLTLWIVEAVNNAVHHAFPETRDGTVTVRFRSAATMRLTVEDDGIGPGSLGNGDTAGVGHGLRLIRALATQLGGETSLVQRAEGGSLATLSFPTRVAEPGATQTVTASSL